MIGSPTATRKRAETARDRPHQDGSTLVTQLHSTGVLMPFRPNYRFERFERERLKKAEKEEKSRRQPRFARKTTDTRQ